MATKAWRQTISRGLFVFAWGFLLLAGHSPTLGQVKEVKLADAIKARTDVSVLAEEAAALNAEIRAFMRKVIAKGEGKQMEGNIYLTKDKYAEAVASYEAAGALYRQAIAAEGSAAESLEGREYAPAKALFLRAGGLFKQVIALQAKRDKVLAVAKTADDSLKLADGAFKTDARPASFERGKQALADGRKALEEDDLDAAEKGFSAAVEQFAKAQGEANVSNELGKAQDAYAAAAAAADEALLAKNAQVEWTAAKAKAADAEAKAKAGDAKAAMAAYQDATKAIKDAFALAKTKENTAKAAPIIERLNAAKDKFAAEDILAQLESLIPSDPRMAALRQKVQEIPGPAKTLTLDLGGSQSLKLLVIRPGKFMMGSPEGEKGASKDEMPQHEVTLTKPFYMGATAVTQAQYEAVMGKNPSNFKGPQNPVDSVSWDDAAEFCKKLSEKTGKKVRLPSEAEREYACRAGTKTRFSFGDNDTDLGDYAWYTSNSEQKTHPVGGKKPNPWGLYDMHGNVWEWCGDWLADSYADAKNVDLTGPDSGSSRVLRGGSWNNNPQNCRSANRNRNNPDNASPPAAPTA